jgi:NAD(P)-dependent dehydrogenase (short-subunit alcohol dehydrogenase family)
MTDSFKDHVAVITGAASGLGLAAAKKLSENGLRLALLDNNINSLEEIGNEFKNETEIYDVDITNEEAVENIVSIIEKKFSRIDILINSAGITGVTNIKTHETSAENIRRVFDVNFFGAYFTSKYILPIMLKHDYGRILHIASIAGKDGNAGMLAYSASKAALIAMTKVQGKEYAETGITINALAPAVIKTALVDAMPEEQVKYMTDKIPMKRCGTLEEVANIIAYIVSPQNSFTTAFTFDLSGGRATY